MHTPKSPNWFRNAKWLHALLSFAVLFIVGAAGALLWSNYAIELPKQSIPGQDQDAMDRRITEQLDQTALTTGLISGTCGLAGYLLLQIIRKKETI
jgi:hypothetical protein